MTAPDVAGKKIILEHTQGDYPGLKQILGPAELLTLGDRPIPPCIQQIKLWDRTVPFASLITVTPRTVLYREAFAKPTGRFGQVMESWDPDQQ